MEKHNVEDAATTIRDDIETRLRPSSPSPLDQDSNNRKDKKTVNNENRGRRHSSSLSAMVGNIGIRLKRSSSSISSSTTDGRISIPKDKAENISTPTKRKNPSLSKIVPDSGSAKTTSRRSSTPVDPRTDTPVSIPKNKKTSLSGIFSSTRKLSLQLTPNNGNQNLPPRPPPQSIKSLHSDTQTSRNNARTEVKEQSTQDEMCNTTDTELKLRNGTNGASMLKSNRHFPSFQDNDKFLERRGRVHKHSLQQGNKWKLLQQKVLGNLDEEKGDDEEQEFVNGKMVIVK